VKAPGRMLGNKKSEAVLSRIGSWNLGAGAPRHRKRNKMQRRYLSNGDGRYTDEGDDTPREEGKTGSNLKGINGHRTTNRDKNRGGYTKMPENRSIRGMT